METDNNVPYGTTPTYNSATPTKAATAQYTYTFNGWTPAISNVEGDVIYTATFSSTVNSYTITWKLDGETVRTETLEYGAMPNYGADPTKESTAQYHFSFAGWSPTPYSVDKDQIYEGTFDATVRKYTITWKDADGSDLDPATTSVQFGLSPTHTAPTKADCTFAGWKASSDQAFYPAGSSLPAVSDGGVYEETYTAVYNCSLSELVVDDETTISDNTEVSITTIHVAGRLSIESGSTLTTADLVLEASASGSGEIVDDSRITVTDHAYFDLNLNTDDWHWTPFGVPFEIDLSQHSLIQKRDAEAGGDRALVLGRDYDIVYYNGETRAAQGPVRQCWEYVEYQSQRILTPGTAYLIAFNHGIGHVNFVRFQKKDEASIVYDTAIPLTYTGSTTNDNWNGIANPRMFHALLGAGVTECQVHNGGAFGDDGYMTYLMDSRKFYVGKAAYVQVPSSGTLSVTQASKDDSPIVAAAPRRAGYSAEDTRFDVQIAPQDGEMADRLYVLAEEDKEDAYVIVKDLVKAGVSTTRAQMWIDRYGVKLCKNTTAFVGDKASYPLSVCAPVAGTYVIRTENAPQGYTLYLTYNGKVIWNLCMSPYPATLEQGTTTEYGLYLVRRNVEVTTGVDEVHGDEPQCIKVIMDDKVFILRGGNVYSAYGQQIQ